MKYSYATVARGKLFHHPIIRGSVSNKTSQLHPQYPGSNKSIKATSLWTLGCYKLDFIIEENIARFYGGVEAQFPPPVCLKASTSIAGLSCSFWCHLVAVVTLNDVFRLQPVAEFVAVVVVMAIFVALVTVAVIALFQVEFELLLVAVVVVITARVVVGAISIVELLPTIGCDPCVV